MKRFPKNDTVVGLILSVGVFLVYLGTISRSVTAEDCGEIAATLSTLGILHPTGYPLFTMLGWLFSHLPLGDRILWRLNLLVALLCVMAVYLFYQLFLFLLSEKAMRMFSGTRLPSELDSTSKRFAAASATLIFAFSTTFWSEAVSVEVYALHLLFLSMVLLFFLRALSENPGSATTRWWIIFAFTLGLSFTNHMMTVLLAPAFLYLFFTVYGFKRVAGIKILKAIPPFLLGLTPYLYLPIRSSQKPVMNWGEPSTPVRFWKHLYAAQYHEQMFSSWAVAVNKLTDFFHKLPSEFGYAPLALAFAGMGLLFFRARRLLVFALLLFVGCLFYSVNYNFDDPNFYLNAYLAIIISVTFGINVFLAQAQNSRWKWPSRIFCLVFVAAPLYFNYRLSDKSRDYAVEDYARNALNSVDSGAIIFSNEYERLAAPAFYLQLVENFRPDVVILDITLLANPWYFTQLEQRYPWLVGESRPAIQAFLIEEDRFVRSKIKDTAAYNTRIWEMFGSMIEKNFGSRPIYISEGINPVAVSNYRRIPSGLMFRLVSKADSMTVTPRELFFHPLPPPKSNPESEKIRNEYASAYGNQGVERVLRGDTITGILLLRKALVIQPDFPAASQWLNLLGQ